MFLNKAIHFAFLLLTIHVFGVTEKNEVFTTTPIGVNLPSPPVFSHPSGFYTEAFELSITHPNAQVTIYFTTDGSNPHPDDVNGRIFFVKNQYEELPGQPSGEIIEKTVFTHLYTAPFSVDSLVSRNNFYANISTTFDHNPNFIPTNSIFKSVVIRAIAVSPDGSQSQVVTANYIISTEGTQRFSLPVTSLSVDPKDWFDYSDGLNVAGEDFDLWRAENPDEIAGMWTHANYWRSGIESERLAHLAYFENGLPALGQNVGLRNHGNSTRMMRNRPIRLYARGSYGASNMNHSFFESVNQSQFRRLILRNGGNDAFGSTFRDAVIQDMFSHLNVAYQAWQPTVLLLNGEYWGVYNLRERYDRHYFERHFQIPEGQIDILENNAVVNEGDNLHYVHFLNFLANEDLATEESWTHINQTIDVDSFIDHFCINIFSANYDWPQNNIYFWRKRTSQFTPNAPFGHDGRWRWVLRDLDVAFNMPGWIPNSFTFNMLEHATSTGGDPSFNPEWSTFVLRKLLENDSFKNQFILRFADLLNSSFRSSYVVSKIDAAQEMLSPEMGEHIERWSSHASVNDWEQKVDAMRHFAQQRPAFQRQHLISKFNLETATIHLSVNQADFGYIQFNTIDILDSTPGITSTTPDWAGVYFKNIPITVKAIPQPGYIFHHWTGINNSFDDEITITLTQNATLRAHFVVDPNFGVVREVLNFWALNTQLPNDTPLTHLTPTYSKSNVTAVLNYHSAFQGYPFSVGHPLWRRASLERRNQPTELNYTPDGNFNLPFNQANIRGVQVRQPFENETRKNHLILHADVETFHDLEFSFAVMDEGAAEKLHFSFTNNLESGWQALPEFSFDLNANFQLVTIPLNLLFDPAVSQKFWLKIEFESAQPLAETGHRVTFNNFMLSGIPLLSQNNPEVEEELILYPNPNFGVLFLNRNIGTFQYEIYDFTGRRVSSGNSNRSHIPLYDLRNGTYMIKIIQEENQRVFKIVKR